MKINLFKTDKLEQQQNFIKEKLQLPSEVALQLAYDSTHGLNELTRSLAQLHPHKKSLAVLGAQPPDLQRLISGFAADGFLIQELPVSFSNPDPLALETAFGKLKKDTLFILGSFLEPLTGVYYPFDFVRLHAPQRNMFSVIYFSPDSLSLGMPVPQNSWEGFVLDPLWNEPHSLSLVLKGERCQGESLFWGKPQFTDAAVQSLAKRLEAISLSANQELPGGDKNKSFVTAFEQRMAKELPVVTRVSDQTPRLFNRAVLFVEGVNGDSLSERLTRLGFFCQSGASCGWNDPHLNNWLPRMGFSEEKVQISIIIPLETLETTDFEKVFSNAVHELRNVSNYQSGLK